METLLRAYLLGDLFVVKRLVLGFLDLSDCAELLRDLILVSRVFLNDLARGTH